MGEGAPPGKGSDASSLSRPPPTHSSLSSAGEGGGLYPGEFLKAVPTLSKCILSIFKCARNKMPTCCVWKRLLLGNK